MSLNPDTAKVFCDFHHGALARFMYYLFADRLGYHMCFPSSDSSSLLNTHIEGGTTPYGGVWGSVMADTGVRIAAALKNGVLDGALDANAWKQRTSYVSPDEIRNTNWDLMIITRTETAYVLQKFFGHPKKGVTYIGVSGNEGTWYDWTWIKNVIATDLMTFGGTPKTVHKLHIPQELGRHFDRGFVPIQPEHLKTINGFTNNLKGFDLDITIRCRKHPVNIYKIYLEMKKLMPEYTLNCYGHGNTETIGCPCIAEPNLPEYYHACALTWQFKTYEGYGHSVLQSLPAGRPCIVPYGFFDDRTAGRYLIDGVTCIKADYDARDVAEKVKPYTQDLDTANAFAKRCYDKQKELFDWAGDAEKVREWLKYAGKYE